MKRARTAIAGAVLAARIALGPATMPDPDDQGASCPVYGESDAARRVRERMTAEGRQRRLELLCDLLGPPPANRAARRERDRRVRQRHNL